MSSSSPSALAIDEGARDAFVERLFGSFLGALELLTIYLGDELGYYRALADRGPLTAAELAAGTGTNERYAREWLEQQAAANILRADTSAEETRFSISPEVAEVLLDPESMSYLGWSGRMALSWATTLPQVADAFQTGGGVPYEAFGADMMHGQAGANRPQYTNLLASEWIPQIPGMVQRLGRPGARIADVGCGVGWSALALARGFPWAIVHGYDLDARSIETARQNLANSEDAVRSRVSFHQRDVAELTGEAPYDLVTIFEALHDFSRPVEVLEAIRANLAADGALLVMDERVGPEFQPGADEVERFMYSASVLHCLPATMAEQPSAATGTVMRESTVRDYATRAGFSSVDVLPIEADFFRFYLLRP